MPLPLAVAVFVAASAIVAVIAPRLTRTVETLSRQTTFGGTIVGTVLLGATTSLPGIVVTVTAAVTGRTGLAIGNAIGGPAAQTMFLALADVVYREGELEQESRSPAALTNLATFLMLLAVPLIALGGWPQVRLGWVHPASIVLVAGYFIGLKLANAQPGTERNGQAEPESGQIRDLGSTWTWFAVFVVVLGGAGYTLAATVTPIARSLGLSSLAAGGLLTALATSSPELVTTLTAAHRGQLELAVGEIVGGNNFDLLFLAIADISAAGSLYAMIGSSAVLLAGVTLLLNGLLLMNFIRRKGDGTVSPESIVMILVYLALALLLVVSK